MVRYHHDLAKLPSTHFDGFNGLKNDLFSIHHNEKAFLGSPSDLALEQTINVDAAKEKKGITSRTNLIGAHQRWTESHSLKTSLLTQMFNNILMNIEFI